MNNNVQVGDRAYHPKMKEGYTLIEKVYKVTGDGMYARGYNGFYAPLSQWIKCK